MSVTEEERGRLGSDVGFIGTYEKDRAEKLLYLAENGIGIRIWGNGWKRWKKRHENLIIEYKELHEDDFIKAICATKINLCFLRKANRDLHTGRSMEIPACGGFMLAERTVEHLELFEEDIEAGYFDIDDTEELLTKVKYWLREDDLRRKVATAARERCLKSGYSYEETQVQMIEEIRKLL